MAASHWHDAILVAEVHVGLLLLRPQGVAQLTRLTELWLVESQLRDASAARECTQLVKLVLCTNRLTEVPDLAPLSKLATLSLAGNRIAAVQNLSQLPALEDVNLADNLICTIGAGLVGCKRLSALNLSGNPISSLKESRNLCGVPSLRHLSLADPVYGVTPMARLCNYRSCLLLHLPQLRSLDGFSVEPEELSQLKKCEVQHQRLDELSRQLQAQARARSYLHRVGPAVPATLAVPDYLTTAAAAAAAVASQDVEVQEGARAAMEDLVVELARWTDELDLQLDVHRTDYEVGVVAEG
ncbi:leucine-rich repeat-containing protein 9-like [Thrips palmi]|uniref:Dynein axonemal assembly factor 1 homolog n=1 Tax=Thrips palmi TaxID=161013 RepID=A0A6P8YSM5_THRPL|nr:leucine-rich repeat-containing protein 9-like [Thrips palmi]